MDAEGPVLILNFVPAKVDRRLLVQEAVREGMQFVCRVLSKANIGCLLGIGAVPCP
jgi:hypothetical protein